MALAPSPPNARNTAVSPFAAVRNGGLGLMEAGSGGDIASGRDCSGFGPEPAKAPVRDGSGVTPPFLMPKNGPISSLSGLLEAFLAALRAGNRRRARPVGGYLPDLRPRRPRPVSCRREDIRRAS